MFYRQIAMYLAHHVGGWSTTPIGKFYNGRDHSTVCHAIAKVESLRKSDQELSSVIDLLASACEDGHALLPSANEPAGAHSEKRVVFSQTDIDFVNLLADRIVERLLTRLTDEIKKHQAWCGSDAPTHVPTRRFIGTAKKSQIKSRIIVVHLAPRLDCLGTIEEGHARGIMTITLELPPETEARLLAQAKARGLTLDAFVKTIITNQAAATEELKPAETLCREYEDSDRAIDEIFDTVEVPPGIGEGAMRRQNWYR